MTPGGTCAWCGAALEPSTGPGRPRRYCCEAHKRAQALHERKLRAPEPAGPPTLAHQERLAHARALAQSHGPVTQGISAHKTGGEEGWAR